MSITVGVVGAGQFAPAFLRLFLAHPDVSDVYLCEQRPDRLDRVAQQYGVTRRFSSYDDLLASDVDAVAIFTERWTHAALTLAALRHGKHVYSAVPMGITEGEVAEIVATVARTGLVYLTGETSYYYPAVLLCRQKWAEGAFGHFVYGEGEYLHDMSNGFYDAYRYSGGPEWKASASFPPMLYPTHSLSGVLSVTGGHVTSVSCLGFADREGDGVFDRGVSRWDNDFSNETALMRTSDGGSLRINELRRVGVPDVNTSVRFSILGTRGGFEQHSGNAIWSTPTTYTDVTAQLQPAPGGWEGEVIDLSHVPEALRDGFSAGFAPVHDRSRLPSTFAGLPNGHEGSHQYLVDDLVTSVVHQRTPPTNAWSSARYTLPGIVAHRSARRDGELLAVPDLGDPPVTTGAESSAGVGAGGAR